MITLIGNTPLVCINKEIPCFAKIEGANPFGSMKDRAALYVIDQLLNQNKIDLGTEIVESSSGNFGIALSAICKIYGLTFTCVTDPMISPMNRTLLELYGANIIFADQPDENGSYLSSRLKIIKQMEENAHNFHWINQYNNQLMIQAYENTLAEEIIKAKPEISNIVVPVSTCGCIAGISRRLKSFNPQIKVIAVDIEGSRIFGHSDYIRHIPGIGLPYAPQNLQFAQIDEIVAVSELECVVECHKLIHLGIIAGGSSGASAAAVRKLVDENKLLGLTVAIFPDRGDRYADTIYNDDWCKANINGYN